MSSSTDKKLDEVKRCIEAAEKVHDKLAREWREAYDVYLGKAVAPAKAGRNGSSWKSDLRVKHAFQQVETLLPEFLVEDPNFEVVPREKGDEAQARTNQKLLDYQLDRDRYAEKRMQAAKKAIIFGQVPIKVTWAYEVRRRKVRNPMPAEERVSALLAGEEVPAFVEQDIVDRDDPTMIVVDPFDFMWDPAATSIDDAAYVLHRSWLTTEQLRAKAAAGLYTGLDEILKKKQSGSAGLLSGIKDRLSGEQPEEGEAKRGDP